MTPPLQITYFSNMFLPYCVYILFSHHDHQLYIGYSANLDERIKDHNRGGVFSTKGRRPLELIYCEFHKSKTDASRREEYLKTTAGKKAIKLMLRNSLKELKYRHRLD
ncbi:MAG: GIY-YIG nuclease family protein [Bacteroidota bacterium]